MSNGPIDMVPTSCHHHAMPLPDDYDTNDNYHKGRGVDAPPLPAGFDCTPGGTPKLKPARRVWANKADKHDYYRDMFWRTVKQVLRLAEGCAVLWVVYMLYIGLIHLLALILQP